MNVRSAKNGWFTFVERNERVQSTEDLSQFTLGHDVQLQHGLIIHLQEQKGEGKKKLRRRGNLARWENVSTNLHHQDLLWCVNGLQLRHRHLLNQAEVVDELPLPLGQLVDHLFQVEGWGGGRREKKQRNCSTSG